METWRGKGVNERGGSVKRGGEEDGFKALQNGHGSRVAEVVGERIFAIRICKTHPVVIC